MGEERRRRRAREDERAGFSLAKVTRVFSRRARAVLDDKLTFGATLMRAGEVDAAAQVIDEVERDVRAEGEVLLEMMQVIRAGEGQAEAK
jgi:hypothetical protein